MFTIVPPTHDRHLINVYGKIERRKEGREGERKGERKEGEKKDGRKE